MKKLVMSVLFILLALGVQADMIVNGGFSSTTINASPAENLDPDAVTPLAVNNGWYQSGIQFAVVGGAGVRNRAISENDSSLYGMGQIVSAQPGLGNGDTLTLSFNQTVVDADADCSFGVYVFGYTGSGAWLVASGDFLPLRGAQTYGADELSAPGNYNRYSLLSTVFANGAANFSADISLTRDYDYYGVVFQGKAVDATDSWTIDNVAMIPEPATIAMLGLGALTMLLARRIRAW
jgi:hypothetical protein